jgi:hypothetical protein
MFPLAFIISFIGISFIFHGIYLLYFDLYYGHLSANFKEEPNLLKRERAIFGMVFMLKGLAIIALKFLTSFS